MEKISQKIFKIYPIQLWLRHCLGAKIPRAKMLALPPPLPQDADPSAIPADPSISYADPSANRGDPSIIRRNRQEIGKNLRPGRRQKRVGPKLNRFKRQAAMADTYDRTR